MSLFWRLFLILGLLSSLVLFQNCTGAVDLSSVSNSAKSYSNGQPYDGKIFINAGAGCPDGTFVESRIELNNEFSATVVRENCVNTERTISSGEFYLNPQDPQQIQFNNNTLVKELPFTLIPLQSTWYHQLTGRLQSNNSLVYAIDMFENSVDDIQAMKQTGHIVICNLSAGTYEPWRPDAGAFLASDIGNPVSSGSSERWADIRSANVRAIMVARMALGKSKGCNGFDFDSVDGYANSTGFPLTMQMQVAYNKHLAFSAHDRHLIVALRNNAELAESLVDSYDLAIVEQCFEYNECERFSAFTKKGKAILAAEYTPKSINQCSAANLASISLAYFSSALDGSRFESCW